MKHLKKMLCLLLAVVMCVAFAACTAPAQNDLRREPGALEESPEVKDGESQENPMPGETGSFLQPVSEPGTQENGQTPGVAGQPFAGQFSEAGDIFRLTDGAEGWLQRITPHFAQAQQGSLPFALLEDGPALEAFLNALNSQSFREEAAVFGTDFFRDYNLVIIPRQSTSGSVRYSANLQAGTKGAIITVSAEAPEIGTCDMADWLLLMPVPKTHGTNVTVVMEGLMGTLEPLPTIGGVTG